MTSASRIDADDLPARIIRIQAHADKGAAADWLIADEAAEVVGKRDGDTHKIAISLRPQRSDDFIERRGRAGQFYQELCAYAPVDSAECRSVLNFTYFYELWKVRNSDPDAMSLSSALEWLKQAEEEAIEIGAFRKLLPHSESETDYPARINKLVKVLERDAIVTDYFGLKSHAEERIANDIRESAKAVVENIERLNAEIAKRELV